MRKSILAIAFVVCGLMPAHAQGVTTLCSPFYNPATGAENCIPLGLKNAPQIAIAAGTSLSAVFDTQATAMFGMFVPAGWTAANITYQAGLPGADGTCATATLGELYDDAGNELTTTVGAVNGPPFYIAFSNPVQWLVTRCVKIRSGTAAAPVNQVSTVILRPIFVP